MKTHTEKQWCWQILLLLAIGWAWNQGSATSPLLAQDQITVRDTRTGKVSQFQAQVVTWDAEQLVYTGNGRQSLIPNSRVLDVAYSRTAKQLEADQQFEAKQFLQAWQSYENAISEEPRAWVKVEMMARQLLCARALNRQTEALQIFLAIRQETPKSRFFHLIPIPWQKSQTDANLLRVFREWLQSGDETQRLIAASWLLGIEENAAKMPLRNLSRSDDSQIAHLATAQLWRAKTLSTTASDLQRWQAAVDRMPPSLQAGPRFLVALGRQQQIHRDVPSRGRDEAIVSMLQIPILFAEQYQLCGAALLEAYQLLVAADREEEATLVLQELQRDFGLSGAAMSLRGRIENLDQE